MFPIWFFCISAVLHLQCSCQLQECLQKLFTSLQLVDLVYVEDYFDHPKSATLKATTSMTTQQLHLMQTVALKKLKLSFWKQGRQPGATTLVLNLAPVDLVDLFEVAWKYYLTDVVVVTSNLSLFTYVPLSRGRCPNLDPVYLGACHNFFMPHRKQNVEDFSGCTFKVPYLYTPALQMDWTSEEDPGIWLKLQKELVKVLHYSLEVSTYPEYGILLANGTYTGMFRALHDGTLDFVVGTFTNNSYMYDFDIVTVYFGAQYYFFAPIAQNIVPWKNLFIVFDLQLWLAFFATLFLVALSCIILKVKEDGPFKSYSYCILTLWKMMYTSNHNMPKSYQLKLTIFLWILLTFLLSSAYQAYMHSCLFIPRQGYQVNTLEKLLDSGLPYGGSFYVKDTYEKIGNEIALNFTRNYKVCSFLFECVDRAAEKRDFVATKDVRSVLWNWKNYLNEDGKPKLYRFPSEAVYSCGIYLRKGNPVKEVMDSTILKFVRSGLLQRWDKYSTFEEYAQKKAVYKQLKLDQLLAAFVMFFVGLALASITFLVEFVH